MLELSEKIQVLERILNNVTSVYADSFKTEIALQLGDFEVENLNFKFLLKLSSEEEIEAWVNKLTSRIVMKFDDSFEQLDDFIFDYIELG